MKVNNYVFAKSKKVPNIVIVKDYTISVIKYILTIKLF